MKTMPLTELIRNFRTCLSDIKGMLKIDDEKTGPIFSEELDTVKLEMKLASFRSLQKTIQDTFKNPLNLSNQFLVASTLLGKSRYILTAEQREDCEKEFQELTKKFSELITAAEKTKKQYQEAVTEIFHPNLANIITNYGVPSLK